MPTTTASAATPARLIVVLTAACCEALALTVRVTVWKPDIVNVTVYSPGGRFGKTKSPLVEVTAVRVPCSAGDFAVTVTPGSP